MNAGHRFARAANCKDLAAPQGFEPRYADPESAVLPLNEGAVSVGAQKRACGLVLILWFRGNCGQLAGRNGTGARNGTSTDEIQRNQVFHCFVTKLHGSEFAV
jgi:hypothetical protein